MPPDPDPKQQAILDAAFRVFSLYGYRRTSMDDIAKETGVSRASLYAHFANKEEIFRSLSLALHEAALAEAERALKDRGAGLADRVEAALAAKLGRLHGVLAGSPHGAEIMDENSRLCGDVVSSSSSRLQAMLATAFRAAVRSGEIDLERAALTPKTAAELVYLAASGLKREADEPSMLADRLHRFVRVFFAGLA